MKDRIGQAGIPNMNWSLLKLRPVPSGEDRFIPLFREDPFLGLESTSLVGREWSSQPLLSLVGIPRFQAEGIQPVRKRELEAKRLKAESNTNVAH